MAKSISNGGKRKQGQGRVDPADNISKQDVESGLETQQFKLVDRQGTSSSVWNLFQAVHSVVTGDYIGYVVCREYKFVYRFKKGASPSTLQKHNCEKSTRKKTATNPAQTENFKIPDHIKEMLIKKFVELCGKDLRPFNIVTGEGFVSLLQEFVNIGAQYGRVKVSDLIPHPTTISRHVSAEADKLRVEFIPEVREAMRRHGCAVETDMWSDKFTKTNYFNVITTHISNDFELLSYVILTAEFPADEAKTGDNIRFEIEAEMQSLGFTTEELDNCTFVTDQASNMKKALASYTRLPCTAHVIATVLRHTFDEKKFLKTDAPEVYALLAASQNIATYFKRSGLCKRLDKSIKLVVETRWNTMVDHLESVAYAMDEILPILAEKEELHRLEGWNGELASELIGFLSKFREVTLELQAKKVPTLHLVLVRYYELLEHCSDPPGGADTHPEMASIRQRAESFIRSKFDLQDEHYTAAFLCPNIRTLRNLSDLERQQAHKAVERLYQQLNEGTEPVVDQSLHEEPHSAKKSRFGTWSVNEDDKKMDLRNEMELYLSFGKVTTEETTDLLPWWKQRVDIFPRLAKLAQSILCIPATSASSERDFSRAGLIVTQKRSAIAPENVNDLLVIHNFYLHERERIRSQRAN